MAESPRRSTLVLSEIPAAAPTVNYEGDVQTELGLRVELALVVPAVPRLDRSDGEAPGDGSGGEPADQDPESRVRAEDEPAHRHDRHVGPPQPGDCHGVQAAVDVGHGALQHGRLLGLHLDQSGGTLIGPDSSRYCALIG